MLQDSVILNHLHQVHQVILRDKTANVKLWKVPTLDVQNPPVIPGEYRCLEPLKALSGDVKGDSNTSSKGVWKTRAMSTARPQIAPGIAPSTAVAVNKPVLLDPFQGL